MTLLLCGCGGTVTIRVCDQCNHWHAAIHHAEGCGYPARAAARFN